MQRDKSKIKATHHINVFAELSHGNSVLLENAKEQRPCYYYETLAAVLMAAFKFEAFLNHLGALTIPVWASIERLAHRNKLEVLATHLNIEMDYSRRPFQTLSELFQARDGIAHGKPELLETEIIKNGMPNELDAEKPKTKWEEICTLDFAERAYADTEEIARVFWTASKLDSLELSPKRIFVFDIVPSVIGRENSSAYQPDFDVASAHNKQASSLAASFPSTCGRSR